MNLQGASDSEPLSDYDDAAFPVVGVGASAGGLEALTALLTALPPKPGAAIVLVQHLEPSHTSNLAEILERSTTMPVSQVNDGVRLQVDHVFVIPPNAVMRLADGVFKLSDRPKGRTPIHTVDEFMISLAKERGTRAIGVILSGAASDGVQGLSAIKSSGGITLVQDPTEAAYDSMPRSSIAAGVADRILSVAGIAEEIVRLTRHPYVISPVESVDFAPPVAADEERDVSDILSVVHVSKGIDLSHYKRATLLRRIARRMAVRRVDSYRAYLDILREDSEEVGLLFGDLLVRVTSFFRNPSVFEALQIHVFPSLLEDPRSTEPVRVWVPGCATGQEPYSVVMLLIEYLEAIGSNRPIQVFASDVREDDLLVARRALYPLTIESEVTPERLERFFILTESGYQLSGTVRDAVVFARHDVTADPPFARLHLVTCRNLLIYLDSPLQRTLLSIFHYALGLNGILMLGEAEGVGAAAELFDSTEHKGIFRRTPVQTPMPTLTGRSWKPTTPASDAFPVSGEPQPVPRFIADAQRQLDEMLLERFSPAAMIVDSTLTILHLRGDAGVYLRPRPGKASLELGSMTSKGLTSAIASAVEEAAKKSSPARRTGIKVETDNNYRTVAIAVTPLQLDVGSPHFAVMIEETGPNEDADADDPARADKMSFLEQELEATNERLRAFEFRGDVVNQDLVAANEEIQSSNEELQSINEELETAKEELQSTNEELTTLNDELQSRNRELSLNNDDLRNLLSSTGIAIVMLDKELKLRRYTNEAVELFNFIPSDVGRPLTDIRARIEVPDLEKMLRTVVNGGEVISCEQCDEGGKWYKMTARPFVTAEGEITGVVVSLYDIDVAHRYQEQLRMSSHFAEALSRTSAVFDSRTDFVGSLMGVACIAANALGADYAEVVLRDEDQWTVRAEIREGISASTDRPLSYTEVSYRGFLRSCGRTLAMGLVVPDSAEPSADLPSGPYVDLSILTEDDVPAGFVRFQWTEPRVALSPPETDFLHRLGTTMGLVCERAQREELARRLAEERTVELQETDERLMMASHVKDEFLASMSHELRTPLNSIIGFSQVMMNGLAGSVNEEQQRQLQMVLNAGNHLLAVVTDILDFEKIEAGAYPVDVDEVVVCDVAKEVVDLIRPLAEAKGLVIVCEDVATPLRTHTDALKLRQIILNLVVNAIKFTSDGAVTVSVAAADDTFTVVVADTGIGMTAEECKHSFEDFSRVAREDPSVVSGTGLGLSIARRLAIMLGGNVTVDSEPGVGSTFRVTLARELAPVEVDCAE